MASAGTGRGKNKMTAGILSILLGGFGIHHFYLGSMGSGIVMLLLVCCGSGVVGWVEGYLLLTMSDEDFDAKYNARQPESMEFVFQKKH